MFMAILVGMQIIASLGKYWNLDFTKKVLNENKSRARYRGSSDGRFFYDRSANHNFSSQVSSTINNLPTRRIRQVADEDFSKE